MRFRVIVIVFVVELATSTLHGQLRSRVQASGFANPVAFVQDPVDRNIQLVLQQNGRIRVVRSGTLLAADFLDVGGSIVSGGEQGLLGMAFAPDTASNIPASLSARSSGRTTSNE